MKNAQEIIACMRKLVPLASIKTSDTVNATDLLEVTVPMAEQLPPLRGICADIKVDPISQSSFRVTESRAPGNVNESNGADRFEHLAQSMSPMVQMI